MTKQAAGSSVEIWSKWYINNPENRFPEDRNAEILQIERGSGKDDYIVEVLKHD